MILYLPEGAEPEVFGPYSTFQQALNMLRALSTAVGHILETPPSGLMAGVTFAIDGERHRYQLLKMASATQLEVHVSVIQDLSETATVEVVDEEGLSPPGPISSY
jgi:hypothetical protein